VADYIFHVEKNKTMQYQEALLMDTVDLLQAMAGLSMANQEI
jgi:hypothetical protein